MTCTDAGRRRWRMGALCYALAFALLFVGADALLRREEEYSGTWSRIREGGGVPQVLIVGNSHAFCSFAPSVLSQALGVDGGLWRYEAEALGEGVEYRFFLDGEPLGDWSDQSSAVLALEPAQARRLSASLRRDGEEISFCFMTPNTCVFQPN